MVYVKQIHNKLAFAPSGGTVASLSGYDTKQSDGEVSEMLEVWGLQSTLSLPGSLLPGVIALNRVLSMGK